jgi:KTSC domain-containing protein
LQPLLRCTTSPRRVFCAEPSPTPNHIISHIPRQRVESNAIAAICYSKCGRILEIEFVNGVVYRYLNVPAAVHRDLMSAESKAPFYDSNINDITARSWFGRVKRSNRPRKHLPPQNDVTWQAANRSKISAARENRSL